MPDFDCIIAGIGGVGSAIAYHGARSGQRILGIEQFDLNHSNGSSHGKTRIYRSAYSEGSAFVPLVKRAQTLWKDLERSSRTKLMARTGGLLIGPENCPTIQGALKSAKDHQLPHELLATGEVRERFPQFAIQKTEVGFWDPEAGALFPEACITAHVTGARRAGADLRFREALREWRETNHGIQVRTEKGEYTTKNLILAAGAWTANLLPDFSPFLQIERQAVHWYTPPVASEAFSPAVMPVFIWDRGAHRGFYGLPDFGDGVKVGTEMGRIVRSPDRVPRSVTESDRAPVNSFVHRSLPGLAPHPSNSVTCLYTNTPDHHFLIGKHPKYGNVILVSACSGHGFKFTSAIGELVTNMVLGKVESAAVSFLDPNRFMPRSSS